MSRVGSVQWAAPEVLLGGEYSHKCDLWCAMAASSHGPRPHSFPAQ
jgi:serine/threonine protein kinase